MRNAGRQSMRGSDIWKMIVQDERLILYAILTRPCFKDTHEGSDKKQS